MSDKTEIVVILDRSGSMQTAKADHEGGLRSFVEDQKSLAGDVRFTLIQFDSTDPCEVVYDGTPIADVGGIDLVPRGGTPLLDAIGKAAAHVEKRVAERKPDQIIVMVITDGEENQSREWTRDRIKQRVTELEASGWKFLFLGANIDSFAEAAAIGVSHGTSMDFANNTVGAKALYRGLSANVRSARVAAQNGASKTAVYACCNFSDEQRAAAMGDHADLNAITKKGKAWNSTSSQSS